MPQARRRSWRGDCDSGARAGCRAGRGERRCAPGRLTARELEVLGLVAQGLHNGEIADRLYLSQRTVDTHVSAILRKLDVRTRSHASAEAVRLGLVPKTGTRASQTT